MSSYCLCGAACIWWQVKQVTLDSIAQMTNTPDLDLAKNSKRTYSKSTSGEKFHVDSKPVPYDQCPLLQLLNCR